MPGTASKLQSRAHAKARPSAAARPTNLVANTPVLFRLPIIPNVPTEELGSAFAESTIQLPTATLAAVSMPAATASMAGPVASSPAQAVAPATTTSAVAETEAHVAPNRSWWEHWSSGIVLIVLLIALATASILAWQGNDKSGEKLLADEKAQSLTDLSAIEVPKLDVPKLELPTSKSDSATAQNKSLHSELTLDEESSLIPDAASSLTFDPPTQPAAPQPELAKPMLETKPEPHATASLQSPIVKQQEPLFKDEPKTATATLSAQPASSQLKTKSTGDSPAIWDSSSNKPAQSSDLQLGPSLELSDPSKTESPSTKSTAAKPATGSPTTSGATSTPALLTSQSNSTATSTTSTESTPVPTNMQYAGKTATPELDRAALFATFRQYSSADMTATADASTNRYKATGAAATTGTTAPPNGFPTSPSGAPTSMVGYTQSPLAPTQPNYTLQTAPNSAPNMQTNPAQQYQPQQYPSQQLPTQQYPTQQPQQQFQGQQPQPQQQYQGQQYQAQPYNGGMPATAPQQFTAPNTGNGYYIPPVTSSNTQPNVAPQTNPNTLNYPSLK